MNILKLCSQLASDCFAMPSWTHITSMPWVIRCCFLFLCEAFGQDLSMLPSVLSRACHGRPSSRFGLWSPETSFRSKDQAWTNGFSFRLGPQGVSLSLRFVAKPLPDLKIKHWGSDHQPSWDRPLLCWMLWPQRSENSLLFKSAHTALAVKACLLGCKQPH